MNFKILTWVLATAILLLCLTDGWLIYDGIRFRGAFKKTFDLKASAFTERVTSERRRIKQEMEERFKTGISLFENAVKNLEIEKKKAGELETALKHMRKK